MPRLASTTARGYGTAHQKERARWQPVVRAGLAECQQGLPGNGSSGTCVMPTRHIQPDTPWHLGHNDTRTAYIGPTHAQCNLAAAAFTRARAPRTVVATSQRW